MSRKVGIGCLLIIALLALSVSVSSHPHFRKSVVAQIQQTEIKLSYVTLPWNSEHLAEVKDGFIFNCGRASVELSQAVSRGGEEIPAGKYQLRARAQDADHWTLILIPAAASGDASQALDLATETHTNRPVQNHLYLDITPGHGDTDHKAILVVAFGDRQLEGVIADF